MNTNQQEATQQPTAAIPEMPEAPVVAKPKRIRKPVAASAQAAATTKTGANATVTVAKNKLVATGNGVEQKTKTEKEKGKKTSMVRDSFSMPKDEYDVLGHVKKMCIKAGFEIKKSELLRIGVMLISQLNLNELKKILDAMPQLKTGRPKKS